MWPILFWGAGSNLKKKGPDRRAADLRPHTMHSEPKTQDRQRQGTNKSTTGRQSRATHARMHMPRKQPSSRRVAGEKQASCRVAGELHACIQRYRTQEIQEISQNTLYKE